MLKKLFKKNIVRFSCSSFVSFLVDYGVYSLVMSLLSHKVLVSTITIANILARIVSSSLNFTINRFLVFESHKRISKAALQFFSLAAFVLFCNSLILNFLTHILDINHYIAKIITELCFFSLNFCVQRFVIFKK